MLKHMIGKEIRQNWTILSLTLAAAILVPVAIVAVDSRYGQNTALAIRFLTDLSGSMAVTFVCPSVLSYLLMATERTKRTFLVYRMLPAATDTVIFAKEATAFGALISLYAVNLASFLLAFRFAMGELPFPIGPSWVIAGLAVLIAATDFSLWIFLAFAQKWATQLPFAIAALMYPVVVVAEHTGNGGQIMTNHIAAIALPVCAALLVVFHILMRKEFDRQDWSMPSAE